MIKHTYFKTSLILFILYVSFLGTGVAETKTTIKSKYGEVNNETRTILLKGNVVLDNKKEAIHLEADRLSVRKASDSKKIEWGEAEGDVSVVRNDLTLETQYGVFNQKTGVAELNRGVKIDSEAYQLIGNRLQYDMIKKTGKVNALPESKVKAIFYGTPQTAKKQRNEIRGESKEIFLYEPSNKAIFQGQVQITEYGFPKVDTVASAETAVPEIKDAVSKPTASQQAQKKVKEAEGRSPEETFQLAYEFEPEETRQPAESPNFDLPLSEKENNLNDSEKKKPLSQERALISMFSAQRAEIFLNKNDEIDLVIASGKVEITQKGRVSKADKAVFDYNTGIIKLIGDAYVKEKGKVEVTSAFIEMHKSVSKGMIKGKKESPVKIEIPVQ